VTQRQFCIWIVSPEGYLHSRTFDEVALSLKDAFAALGHDVPIVTDATDVSGTAVVLGGHFLARLPHPNDLIVFNLEQLAGNSDKIVPGYLDVLKRYPVWDYSTRNIAALAEIGVRAALCGVGYMPSLTRIPEAAAKDIDVLFVGSFNERRRAILQEIAAKGANTYAAFQSYGEERDALIARAKIVLNMHFYPAKLFEIVRVSYLLANRVCVLSETGHDDELEAPFRGGVAFASYGGIVQACFKLLQDDDARARIAEKGFEQMRALSQVDMLRRALSQTLLETPMP
jgi:hypothetical protein